MGGRYPVATATYLDILTSKVEYKQQPREAATDFLPSRCASKGSQWQVRGRSEYHSIMDVKWRRFSF